MARTLVYVGHDHLNRNRGALAEAKPDTHEIVIVESERMLSAARWHKQRIFFMLSAARHFAQSLRDEGFIVHLERAENTSVGISAVAKPNQKIIATEPSSYRATRSLQGLGVHFIPNDFFITPRALFLDWAKSQKQLKMENFYRWQRTRLSILMEGEDPLGGRWNYDDENRLAPPEEPHPWPKYPHHERDEIDLQVIKEIENLDLIGSLEEQIWGTTREAALEQLDFFLKNSFAEFGPYEDAMTTHSWQLYHSLLSPYLNVGLITADEVVSAALKQFKKGKIPLSSCEGFIRQIIGWREYIHGIYWYFGEEYRHLNHFDSQRKLLPLFADSQKTSMVCVADAIKGIEERSWVHHIPRLMILSNLAMLADIKPSEFLSWMREVFIDAADWVMVPNVVGMSMHADGGKMSTKPYVAGGAYISRMSNYCGSCKYNPKERTGENACPFTTLYWHYLNRNSGLLKKNHRMFQQINGIKRLKDREETLMRGDEILAGLEQGEI
jgi:deoxyribodipyrimidine photolyase-related protein